MKRMERKATLGIEDVEIFARDAVWHGYFRIDRYRLRHRLHAGGWSDPVVREVFERGHSAALLPYDPVLDRVVLVEQFRIGALSAGLNPWIIEIPAGIIEPQESPEDVAIRETVEETGSAPDTIAHICDYLASPGGASEKVSLYCGRIDATDVGGLYGNAEEAEDILVYAKSFADICSGLDLGIYKNAPTLIALQWLVLNRDRLRVEWAD